MKAAVLYTVIASLSFSGLNSYAQSCTTGGGNHAGPTDTNSSSPLDFPPINPSTLPSAADVTNFLNGGAASPATPSVPAAPAVRITVVDPALNGGAGSSESSPSTPGLRITVFGEGPSIEPKTPSAEPKQPNDENDKLDAALSGLVGTWKAVARDGDGELTTVELQLDNRGWAKLIVPATDGTKSTIKRRVEFENQEIKLTGPDAELLLGKLVSFNTRQMVLERAGGQVTFVRP